MMKKRHQGFTLAELLIALAILGVIATFTIPKVISAQQDQRYNAIAKEAAATIADAYLQYKQMNTITAGFGIRDLTPFINYVSVDTTSQIDYYYSLNTINCIDFGGRCLKLHNGAYLQYWTIDTFGGTTNLNALPFLIDPDGKVTDGTTNGPGKSIGFYLYTTGKITDDGNVTTGSNYNNGGTVYGGDPNRVPPWFHW